MKISCSNNFAKGNSLKARASFIARSGFDAIELAVTPEELENIMPEIKSIINSGEILVSAICALHRGWLIDPDESARTAALEDVTKLIHMAGEIGNCGVFVIPILNYTRALPGGLSTGRTPDEDRDLLAKALGKLGRRAEEVNTKIWLEVINRYESPVANTLAESAKIIEKAESPACQLHPDFFHMNIEEVDLPRALHKYGELIGYIHLADTTRTYPGFGRTNYLEMIQALVEVEYDGYLTVDAGDERLDPEVVLPSISKYLRGTISIAKERVRVEKYD